MIITMPGIFLPNGHFLKNNGSGHAKTAILFCERYPELYELLDSQSEYHADEFMITAGCAITAGYGGKPCFKIAEDNVNPILMELKSKYEQEKYSMFMSWKINLQYKATLDKVMKRKELTKTGRKGNGDRVMNLRYKTGFVINKEFYPNNGLGHEKNAMNLINEFGWDWNGTISAQDFIVCKKGAIQVGSGINYDVVVVGKEFFTQPQVQNILKQYKLYGYKCYRV